MPSSAAVEKLFSFTGMINTPIRSNLSDKTFEKLVFLKGNQQFLVKYWTLKQFKTKYFIKIITD